jgi:XRE family aerobic/anaerobic benzoate catabolism transcriptional regulator
MLWPLPGPFSTVCRIMTTRRARKHNALSAERATALGQHVRTARTGAGLTQEDLAAASNLTVQHLQKVERGTGNPTLATVYALADALGIPVGSLLA